MPGHAPCEAGLCERNEEIFWAAKHFVKVVSEPSVSMKVEKCLRLAWDLVCLHFARLWGQPSLRFFPFLFQCSWRCSTPTLGRGIEHALGERLAGRAFSEGSGDRCLKAAAWGSRQSVSPRFCLRTAGYYQTPNKSFLLIACCERREIMPWAFDWSNGNYIDLVSGFGSYQVDRL